MPRTRIKSRNEKDMPAINKLMHDYDNLMAAYRLQNQEVQRLYAEFRRLNKQLEAKETSKDD
ncbi:hypothetical protein PALU110988_19280 [Paenibacillus lupini]|uniref:hypothetical protein n=1 Tax=Paenibacillus lupini TaxID=1450204 RepID=UPI0014208AA0|nr:hypothetical protein [Paenibacillus lupini]NIK24336.1 putative nucleic acid-binding Zn-ribbon protein [Paenibacillus lupini]